MHDISSYYSSKETEICERSQIIFENRSEPARFELLCMDDRARKSRWILCLQEIIFHTNTTIDLVPVPESFKLSSGIHKNLGTTRIRFSIENTGNYLEYETDVIKLDTIILFGLE